MAKKTPLYQEHVSAGAKIVEFGGWDMPVNYGSQIEEHHKVRQDAGVFDVSHMTIVDILGTGARDYLRHLLANNVDRLKGRGKAIYSCMLNHEGGVIDDLIVYFLDVNNYRIILNAATREKDLAWMNECATGYSVGLHERPDLAMVAVQGPNAIAKTLPLFPPALMDAASTIEPFECVISDTFFVGRTGYTGEDGFEIILPNNHVVDFWQKLLHANIAPCGLGARDTLRLEAGLPLYGAEMDEQVSPLEAGLAWTIAWDPIDRLFVGRAALELQKSQGIHQKLVGLILEDPGVLRGHQKVITENEGEGLVTSGSFSPTLNCSIGLARVPVGQYNRCQVEIRGKRLNARIVKPNFVRKGKSVVQELTSNQGKI